MYTTVRHARRQYMEKVNTALKSLCWLFICKKISLGLHNKLHSLHTQKLRVFMNYFAQRAYFTKCNKKTILSCFKFPARPSTSSANSLLMILEYNEITVTVDNVIWSHIRTCVL